MSCIGKKIYEYLKECEGFKAHVYTPKTDSLGEPPRSNSFSTRKSTAICREMESLPNFNFTPPPPAPERVPFENFKNNRKKMKKTIEHNERYTITSIKEDGKVSLTIETKKGFDVRNVQLEIATVELPKEPVLPKELLSPKPELQAQCDIYAKLLATREYYNGSVKFTDGDLVYVFDPKEIHSERIMIKPILCHRLSCFTRKLFFKDEETAKKFLENFTKEIESVKHLI